RASSNTSPAQPERALPSLHLPCAAGEVAREGARVGARRHITACRTPVCATTCARCHPDATTCPHPVSLPRFATLRRGGDAQFEQRAFFPPLAPLHVTPATRLTRNLFQQKLCFSSFAPLAPLREFLHLRLPLPLTPKPADASPRA